MIDCNDNYNHPTFWKYTYIFNHCSGHSDFVDFKTEWILFRNVIAFCLMFVSSNMPGPNFGHPVDAVGL